MYTVVKTMEIAGAHHLVLDYESPCQRPHGHNWRVKVVCQTEKLDQNGMVIDFTKIKKVVNQLDHQNLNEILPFNPTAEHIAEWIAKQIPFCKKVEVQESDGNLAIYEV